MRPREHQIGDVEAESHHTIFVTADEFTIKIELANVTNAFEFKKDFAAGAVVGKSEAFAIPGDACRKVFDIFLERVVFIPGVWRGHGLPL